MSWHALMVQSGSELDVQQRLHRSGMDTLVPVEYRNVRVSRHSKRLVSRPYALLTGYVIADIPPAHWHTVSRIPEVRGVVYRDGEPATLTANELDQVKDIDARPSMIPHTRKSFAPGELVEITRGAFSGIKFRFEDRHKSTAITTLPFLGGEVEAKIPLDWLAPAH